MKMRPRTIVLLSILLFFILFIFPHRAHAIRPFVTEEARTADTFQFDAAAWIKGTHSNFKDSIGQFLFVGVGLTDWLQISGASGRGYDFNNGEQTVSNPSIQGKLLFWDPFQNGIPGLALIAGVNLRTGRGDAYYDDATSYYYLTSLTSRFFDDWLEISANLGKRYVNERYQSTFEKNYWAISGNVGVFNKDYRLILEAFSGDPYHALVPSVTYQAGGRYHFSETVQFDLLFGIQSEFDKDRIRTGRRETWSTLGIRVLFEPFKK
jgi:hypothetical protein